MPSLSYKAVKRNSVRLLIVQISPVCCPNTVFRYYLHHSSSHSSIWSPTVLPQEQYSSGYLSNPFSHTSFLMLFSVKTPHCTNKMRWTAFIFAPCWVILDDNQTQACFVISDGAVRQYKETPLSLWSRNHWLCKIHWCPSTALSNGLCCMNCFNFDVK